ncbi:MAG: type V CRISPR-associated endonuclease Cas1 [Campylobacteraceae bacterium]|jgi:CRISPR-associated endonuclease Cas1|nr:type V CRISPR-associated endonuclease Cas1 [Campylobacteraceae bacterium]
MFTHKDIKYRSIFVINCIKDKSLRVANGELLLENIEEKKTLTKLPFQKILALFIIGPVTVTTPLIDKCTRYGISLVVMKQNLRPVFFFSITAEANFLLRKKQYEYNKENLQIPKILVINKIKNQLILLEKTRLKTSDMKKTKEQCSAILSLIPSAPNYDTVMGLEGKAATLFFSIYFEPFNWKNRSPRTKIDPINATLDIGYTILFNFIEVFVRLFGFDPYKGVYHQLWFKRKSLICDLVEPFRCIIDKQVRKAFNTKQCKIEDFNLFKNEYILKREKNSDYTKMFYDVLIEQKIEIFNYMRKFYRCFMQQNDLLKYPQFLVE